MQVHSSNEQVQRDRLLKQLKDLYATRNLILTENSYNNFANTMANGIDPTRHQLATINNQIDQLQAVVVNLNLNKFK